MNGRHMDLDEEQPHNQYNSDVAIFYEIITQVRGRGSGRGLVEWITVCLLLQVDWSEPWLVVLIGAHLAVFILILCSRGRVNTLAVLLAVLGRKRVRTPQSCANVPSSPLSPSFPFLISLLSRSLPPFPPDQVRCVFVASISMNGVLRTGSESLHQSMHCRSALCFSTHRRFSRHQYFDSAGLFTSVVFSLPILLNCILTLVIRHAS